MEDEEIVDLTLDELKERLSASQARLDASIAAMNGGGEQEAEAPAAGVEVPGRSVDEDEASRVVRRRREEQQLIDQVGARMDAQARVGLEVAVLPPQGGGGGGGFEPNEAQRKVLAALDAGKAVEVIFGAGTGKTALIVAKARERLLTRPRSKVLVCAPQNTHVDKLCDDMAKDAVLRRGMSTGRLVLKTASAAMALPMYGLAKPQHMFEQLPGAMKALLQEKDLFIIFDEAALLSCFKRDAISELLKLTQGSSAPDGGLQILSMQDHMQGEPMHSEAEKQVASINGVMLKELNIHGDFMSDAHRETIFLTESNRFIGPHKQMYEDGANEIRAGCTGKKAQAMVKMGQERTFTDEEVLARARTVCGWFCQLQGGAPDDVRMTARCGMTARCVAGAEEGVPVWHLQGGDGGLGPSDAAPCGGAWADGGERRGDHLGQHRRGEEVLGG